MSEQDKLLSFIKYIIDNHDKLEDDLSAVVINKLHTQLGLPGKDDTTQFREVVEYIDLHKNTLELFSITYPDDILQYLGHYLASFNRDMLK